MEEKTQPHDAPIFSSEDPKRTPDPQRTTPSLVQTSLRYNAISRHDQTTINITINYEFINRYTRIYLYILTDRPTGNSNIVLYLYFTMDQRIR